MKRGYLLTVLLLLGVMKAELDLNKPAEADDKSRELYTRHPVIFAHGVPARLQRVNRIATGRVIAKTTRRVRRGLDGGEPAGGPALKPQQRSVITVSAENMPTQASCYINEDPDFKYEEDVNCDISSILKDSADQRVEAWLSYKSEQGVLTCNVTLNGFEIVEDISQIEEIDTSDKEYLLTINENGNKTSEYFTVKDNILEATQDDETSAYSSEIATGVIEDPTDNDPSVGSGADDRKMNRLLKGFHKVTLIRKGRKLQIEELEIQDAQIISEPEGENFEDVIVSGEMEFSTEEGNVVEDVIIDHGTVKLTTEAEAQTEAENTEVIPPPDLGASGEISAIIIEDTPTGKTGFDAVIVNGEVENSDQTPEEIYSEDETVEVITDQDGQHIIQTAEMINGTFASEAGITEEHNADSPPVAEVLGEGIVTGEAIIETENGLELEEMTISNSEITEVPEDLVLSNEIQQVDFLIEDADGEQHIEHVLIEGEHVVNAVAEDTTVEGVPQPGEEQYDVLIPGPDGYQESSIIVDNDDTIVEEAAGTDFEHGDQTVHVIVPNEHDHHSHIEDWHFTNAIRVDQHIESFTEVHNNPGMTSINSQSHHVGEQTNKGSMHVQLLLDYNNTTTVQDAIVQNDHIIEESPGIDLFHGTHIAKEIFDGADGMTEVPVVIQNSEILPTDATPVHEDHFDLSQGDHHAEMIEGQGPDATVDEVEILNGNIVNESLEHHLDEGTHIVETVFEEGNQTHIQKNIIINGKVLQIGAEANESGIILIKRNDEEHIIMVELEGNTIVKQSEDIDLTDGVFVGTLIKFSPLGAALAPENVVIQNGVISEVTQISSEPDEPAIPTSGSAIIIINHSDPAEDAKSEIFQIKYDGSEIKEVLGDKAMCSQCTGIEVIMSPETLTAINAREVEIDNMVIKVIGDEPQASPVFDASEETPSINDAEITSPEHETYNSETSSTEHEVDNSEISSTEHETENPETSSTEHETENPETSSTEHENDDSASDSTPVNESVEIDNDSSATNAEETIEQTETPTITSITTDESLTTDTTETEVVDEPSVEADLATPEFDQADDTTAESAEERKRNLYSKPYNPLKNRGLNIRTKPAFNNLAINRVVNNRIALSHAPVAKPYVSRVTYQQAPVRRSQIQPTANLRQYNPQVNRGQFAYRPAPARIGLRTYNPVTNRQQIGFRPAQLQPRFQQNVYRPVPAFHPANQMMANLRTTGGRSTSITMNRQPTFAYATLPVKRFTHDETVAAQTTAIPETAVSSHVFVHSDITFDDVPPMIAALDKVNRRYENYYSVFPFSDSDHKLLVNSHEEVMEYYEKMRKFVRKVIEDRHELMNDFDIIIEKSNQLATGEKEMIAFYGYRNTFESINEALKEYNSDERVTAYQKNIDLIAGKFAVQVKDARTASANLVQLENYFSDEITQINQITDDNESQASLEKYDRMLALGMKLIETKKELEVTNESLKTSLQHISLFKGELDDDISGLRKVLESETLVKINAPTSSALKVAVLAILGTMLLL